LAVAWSEHAFETAFLSVGADCAASGLGVCCATAALEPIRTTNADNIKVLENLIATSLKMRAHGGDRSAT
jgi:hypothetical protein